MNIAIRRLALGGLLAVGSAAWADDATKPGAPDVPKPPAEAPKDAPKPPSSGIGNSNPTPQLHSIGHIDVKLSKSGDDKVTVKVPTTEQTPATGRRRTPGTRVVEKDHDYDLASDAKIRWHSLPKKPDGKSYTDQEYQALREPVGALGFKADKSDLKPGQTVRLYLSKAGKNDDPVVTTVVIMVEAPKHDDKAKK
jgi:hypothetical protein